MCIVTHLQSLKSTEQRQCFPVEHSKTITTIALKILLYLVITNYAEEQCNSIIHSHLIVKPFMLPGKIQYTLSNASPEKGGNT